MFELMLLRANRPQCLLALQASLEEACDIRCFSCDSGQRCCQAAVPATAVHVVVLLQGNLRLEGVVSIGAHISPHIWTIVRPRARACKINANSGRVLCEQRVHACQSVEHTSHPPAAMHADARCS